MVARIWAKLSYFICGYSYNISCKFHMVKQTQQFKLKLTFSSEFANQTLHSFSSTVQTFQYLNRVFKMFTGCSNADFGLPLPARHITAKPISSTQWRIVYNVFKLHFLSGWLALIALAPNPCSQSVWIWILSSLLSLSIIKILTNTNKIACY